MVNLSAQFVQTAQNIIDQVASLLNAPVFVTDDQGIVISSSELCLTQKAPFWKHDTAVQPSFLKFPLQYGAEAGAIVVGEPFDQEAISPRIAQALVELVIAQTATHQNHTSSHQELKDQFINNLLHGRVQHEEIAVKYGNQFEIDLNPPRAVILIDAAAYILGESEAEHILRSEYQRRTRKIIHSIVNFFHLPNDTICANLGQGEICVLKASDTKNLGLWAHGETESKGTGSSWANLVALKRAADALLIRLRNETATAIDIGIGRYHPGVAGLARSYEDARAALSLGSRFRGHNRVHCLGELGVAAFVGVADEQTKVDLAKYLLSPLEHERELFTTLDVFFSENCCPSSTAKRLSIHRNTLSYRLDKIFSLTGLEPRKFDDAVQMRLCLLLRSLHPHTTAV
jgi:carbohydrate diacid regulator